MYSKFIYILISILIIIIFLRKDNVLGITIEGVKCYLNGGWNKGEENRIENGIYTGMKWECVEFVRRYLIQTKKITFKQIKNAKELLEVDFFIKINTMKRVDINHFKNGEKKIEKGDIIIMENERDNNGHVCIISNIINNKVEIIEQNHNNKSWNNKFYSRILIIKGNKIEDIDNKEKIIGIIRIN